MGEAHTWDVNQSCSRPTEHSEVGDGHHVHSRVATRISVGGELGQRPDDTSLLGQFALGGLVQALARELEASWRRPHPEERGLSPTDEQHLEGSVDDGQDHDVDRHGERREPPGVVAVQGASACSCHNDQNTSGR